ncbi:PAS domain S-box protein [Candidatus Fermentibacterales bacterium]|nr:PAS domain S-box protein [Candidatus Fermentibacterales bacterium]
MSGSGRSKAAAPTFPDSGLYVYRKRRFLYVSEAMSAITGHARKRLLSIDPGVLTHPDDEPDLLRRERDRSAGEYVPPVYTMRIVRSDGEEAILLIATESILFEGEPATLGRCRDISDLDIESERECIALGEQMRARGLADNYRALFLKLSSDMVIMLSAISSLLDEAVDHVAESSQASRYLARAVRLAAEGEEMCGTMGGSRAPSPGQAVQSIDLSGLILDMHGFLAGLAPRGVLLDLSLSAMLPVLVAEVDSIRLMVMSAIQICGQHGGPAGESLGVRTCCPRPDTVEISFSPCPAWLSRDLLRSVEHSRDAVNRTPGSTGLESLVSSVSRSGGSISVRAGGVSAELAIELPAGRSARGT